jgi:hypothetical protein
VVRVCCTGLCYKEGRATAGVPEAVYIPAVLVSDHVGVAAVSFSVARPVLPAAPARPMHVHQRTVATDRFRLAFTWRAPRERALARSSCLGTFGGIFEKVQKK